MANVTFQYPHDAVRLYFADKNIKARSLINAIGSYNMTLGLEEEWLNNYTTLMAIWFCENLYFPNQTNNQAWETNLSQKLQNGQRESISDIMTKFGLNTISCNQDLINGVNELTLQLSKYHALSIYRKTINLEKETLTGQRMNLTLKVFNEIRKSNKSSISNALKKQYPFDPKSLIDHNLPLSHIDISGMEYKRESEIIDYLLWFDGEVVRPILVSKGVIED